MRIIIGLNKILIVVVLLTILFLIIIWIKWERAYTQKELCKKDGGFWAQEGMPYACCCPKGCSKMINGIITEMNINDKCECCLRE